MARAPGKRNSAAAPQGSNGNPRPPISDAWFRSVVEAAHEGIWIIDLDAQTIFANQRMAAILGTTPEEMIGRTPFDFLFDEDFENGLTVMDANYRGTPVEFEISLRRIDGRKIPVLGGSAPLRDENGRISGSVATFSDLTARLRVEQALVTSERDAMQSGALLSQLLEAATDAIWMRDPDGAFRVANPAACRVMGGSRDEIVGRSVFEIWGPAVGEHLAAEAKRMLESRQAITVEEEMHDAGRGANTIFLSNKVPIYSDAGEPMGILGISRDITGRKRDEIELEASRAKLAQQLAELNALYGSAPIGLGFFDREYRYVRINDELANINGVAAADHIGKTIREVLPVNAPSVEPIIDRVFATGQSVRDLEVSGETPQQPGVTRHWLTGFYPVHNTSGGVEAVGAWVIEISERKRAEEREVLLAREVDHRAKNLLAVVQSVVQLTQATEPADLKQGILGRIQSLARAHSLLADARWDGAQLADLVREELAPYRDSSEDRVTVDGPPLLLRPAAAQSIAMVLHELATNAAKYGALSVPEGQLEVTWGRSPSAVELTWIERGGPRVKPPETNGFGSRIMRATIERQLHGKLTQEWAAAGLRCTIAIGVADALGAADLPA